MKHLVFALALVSCLPRSEKGRASSETSSAPVAAGSLAASVSAASAAPTSRVVSLVQFDGSTLAVCMQFTGKRKAGALPSASASAAPSSSASKPEGMVVSEESCSATFPGKTIFATCEIDVARSPMAKGWKDESFEIDGARAFYYLHKKVFETDVELKQCLDMGGKWKPIEKDSDEYKAWDREERRKRLEKLTDTISR